MARSTFEGPILSGDKRFGAFRNVGYTQLVQNADLDLSNNVVATATYSGASGQFVNSNGIPNSNATIYQPSASVYPSVVQTSLLIAQLTSTVVWHFMCLLALI